MSEAAWDPGGDDYSSALYRRGDEKLEEAQEAKLDHVIELLEIAGGERVLEIGCGWGELAERLVVTSRFNSRCGPSRIAQPP